MTLDGSFTVYKGRQISCAISNIENIVFERNDKGEKIKGKYYNLNELYTVSNPTAFKLNRNDEEENYYIYVPKIDEIGLLLPNFISFFISTVITLGSFALPYLLFTVVKRYFPLTALL